MTSGERQVTEYRVWDLSTRWFHWTNAVCVVALMGIGTVILNGGVLGLSNDGKVLLKTWHVWIGYLFLANLAWRLVWAFFGNRHARWRSILPGGRGYARALGDYLSVLRSGRAEPYLGHNPLGRLAVTGLLLLLLVQGLTGLVLAGTDIYYPPFGSAIAQWIAADGVDPAALVPYRPELLDASANDAMRALRAPIVETHELLFFVLIGLVVLHIVGVVVTEFRGGGSLVSAMVTGRKTLTGRPLDLDDGEKSEDR